jgi:hypothetical protein
MNVGRQEAVDDPGLGASSPRLASGVELMANAEVAAVLGGVSPKTIRRIGALR